MSPSLRGPGNEKLRSLVCGAVTAAAAAAGLVGITAFNRKAEEAPGVREGTKDVARGRSSAVPGIYSTK